MEMAPMRIIFCGVGAIGSTAAVLCRNLEATLAFIDLLSDHARQAGKALVHGALSGDGTFGLVRWDERFVPDAEDRAGQATCEGGRHLPLIGLLGAALARIIQDYVKQGWRRDVMVNLNSVTPTSDT